MKNDKSYRKQFNVELKDLHIVINGKATQNNDKVDVFQKKKSINIILFFLFQESRSGHEIVENDQKFLFIVNSSMFFNKIIIENLMQVFLSTKIYNIYEFEKF